MTRASAVALLVVFVIWLAFAMVSDSLPSTDPRSYLEAALRLAVLLLGPFCWLALVLIQIRSAKQSRLPRLQIADIQRWSWLFGPVGNVWAIFKLTKGA